MVNIVTGTIHTDIDEGVCTITIENEGKRNAIGYTIIDELIQAFESLADRDDYPIVVLTGAGNKAFSAGFDLTIDRTEMTQEEKESWPKMCDLIENYAYPTIAMINGHTYGGAMEVIACCDFRIAVDDASFGITPAKLGLVYSGYAIGRVQRLIGPANTKELLFTGEPIDSTKAYQMGLLNDVVGRSDLDTRTYEMATTMSNNAPLSLRYMKEIVNTINTKTELTEVEHRWIMDLRDKMFQTHDYQEGVEAFHEGRTPDFQGR